MEEKEMKEIEIVKEMREKDIKVKTGWERKERKWRDTRVKENERDEK